MPLVGRALVTAGLALTREAPILLIVSSSTRARQLGESLSAWLGPTFSVESFAERDAFAYERIPADPATRQSRMRALTLLASGRPGVVVVSSRALMDRLSPPDELFARSIELSPQQVLTPAALLTNLVESGYEPTPLVEDIGTISHRGGIVDVFPLTESAPVRIEFFGDEIDTLRSFDVATQRSHVTQPSVSLGPALEILTKADSEAISQLEDLDADSLPELSGDLWRRELDRVCSGDPFPTSALFGGYFASASLIDFLSKDSFVHVEDPHLVRSSIEEFEAQAIEIYGDLCAKSELPIGIRPPHWSWTNIEPWITSRRGIDFGWLEEPILDDFPVEPSSRVMPTTFHSALRDDSESLNELIKSINPYGGRLKTFIDEAEVALASGQPIVITSRQDARLAELFNEREITPSVVASITEPPAPGSLTIVHGSLAEGIRLVNSTGPDLLVYTDVEIFGWAKPRRIARARPATRDAFLSDLVVDDYIVHIEHGVGRYRGLVHMQHEGVDREYLAIDYSDSDRLFVPVEQADRVSRYVGGEHDPSLHRLGGGEWARAKSRAKAAVVELAGELLELYAAREIAPGHAFAPDTVWQTEMESAFPYVETPDQLLAIADVKADMERQRPMDRLLCGDVGYGKTEVAVRAAFKAVMDGRQVAVLVPTTVLAQQHVNTFRERMSAFPIRIDSISRFRTPRDQKAILAGLGAGSIDICIGTHRILQKDVGFKDLGLVIIDEEQRFGVSHKERLKQLRREVDVLTLSATPIPRTLHMSLAGVRDMSTMETPPEDRLPIRTYVQPADDGLIREAILREMDRGGQIYYVHNRVETIYQQAQRLQALVPNATFEVGHGQLTDDKLEKVMVRFAAGDADVLVCTTIIESGLDIPNVNTIIVNNADFFGLSQLYQLRGRVGRGSNRAYAYFLYRRGARLPEVAEMRLRAIQEANELGAGFRIAMKDLEIRGAGNLLGADQSGHVAAVGFQLYSEMLAEAVAELRGKPIERAIDVSVDLPLDAYLPKEYVNDESSRLLLYRKFAAMRSTEELSQTVDELRDRYGALPERALDLIWMVQLRLSAATAGIVAITTTNNEIVLRFVKEDPLRLRALESRFAPHLRAGRAYIYLDRVGLGLRWQGVLDDIVGALQPTEKVVRVLR